MRTTMAAIISSILVLLVSMNFLLVTPPLKNVDVVVSSLSLLSLAPSNPTNTKPQSPPSTKPLPIPTLLHPHPYFPGGFRNQHMRFVAFVNFAVQNNITQLSLPSLRWRALNKLGSSASFDQLFDVAFWNERAEKMGLPRLVSYDSNVLEGVIIYERDECAENGRSIISIEGSEHILGAPCWNATSGLYSGLDEGFYRRPGVNIMGKEMGKDINLEIERVMRTSGVLSHCLTTVAETKNNSHFNGNIGNKTIQFERFTHLISHGGGTQAGILWWEYGEMQKQRTDAPTVGAHPEHGPVEKAIYELLRPSKQIRRVIEEAVIEGAEHHHSNHNSHSYQNRTGAPRSTPATSPKLLALHPRIEPDMLLNHCGKFIDSNLTRVFERIGEFPAFRADSTDSESSNYINDYDNCPTQNKFKFDVIFLAISRNIMEKNPQKHQGIVAENLQRLNDARDFGLFHHHLNLNVLNNCSIPMFESGKEVASGVELDVTQNDIHDMHLSNVHAVKNTANATALGVDEIVASVIDFFTAVRADIFVGVKGSTFSTDVFAARYYLSQKSEEERGGGRRRLGQRGFENYIIGPDGIDELIGPPPPHSCK